MEKKKEILKLYKELFYGDLLSPSEYEYKCEEFTDRVMRLLFYKEAVIEAKKQEDEHWNGIKDFTNYTEEKWREQKFYKPNYLSLIKE